MQQISNFNQTRYSFEVQVMINIATAVKSLLHNRPLQNINCTCKHVQYNILLGTIFTYRCLSFYHVSFFIVLCVLLFIDSDYPPLASSNSSCETYRVLLQLTIVYFLLKISHCCIILINIMLALTS